METISPSNALEVYVIAWMSMEDSLGKKLISRTKMSWLAMIIVVNLTYMLKAIGAMLTELIFSTNKENSV